MKFVRYTIRIVYPPFIEGDDERVEYFAREIPCRNGVSVNDAIEIAKGEAYNGEYTIEDDGQPDPEPTEQEQLRADVDFLLAMGGVL